MRLVGYPFIYGRFYTSQAVGLGILPSTVGPLFSLLTLDWKHPPKNPPLAHSETRWEEVWQAAVKFVYGFFWLPKELRIQKSPPRSANVFPKKIDPFCHQQHLWNFLFQSFYIHFFLCCFFPQWFVMILSFPVFMFLFRGNHLFNCSGCSQEAPSVVRCQWPLAPERLVDWGAAMKSFSLAAHRSRFIGLPSFIWEMVGWAPFLTLDLCAAEWCDYVTNLVSTVYTLVYHGISRNLSYSEISYVVANGHWGERSAICLWVLKISPKSRVWDSFLKP